MSGHKGTTLSVRLTHHRDESVTQRRHADICICDISNSRPAKACPFVARRHARRDRHKHNGPPLAYRRGEPLFTMVPKAGLEPARD